MSYYTVTVRRIDVIGRVWMPCGTCALSYNLTVKDTEAIRVLGNGWLTRDGVQRWLDANAGDFRSIEDFRADIEDFLSEWESPESEYKYLDCMYPAEA